MKKKVLPKKKLEDKVKYKRNDSSAKRNKQTRYVFDKSNFLAKKKGLTRQKTLREKLKEQLKASRFRYLNEQFYVSSSEEAKDYFEKNPEEFIAYHKGYEQQSSLWPKNPVDEIIKELKRRIKPGIREVVADFGCGQAKLAQSLEGANCKVFSFDFVATNKYVTACDMSHTNLFSSSVDIAVFCLSLMGSNLSHYIKEANRVLKDNGILKIAEVKSRFEKVENFIQSVEKYRFVLIKKDISDDAFYYFDFRKKGPISKHRKKNLPEIELKSCLYKQR